MGFKIIILRLRLLWVQSNYIRVAFQTVIFCVFVIPTSVLPTGCERHVSERQPKWGPFNGLCLSESWELNAVELNKWRDSSITSSISLWANKPRSASTNSSRTKAHQSLSENLIYDAAEWAVLRSAVCLVTVRCWHSKLVWEQRTKSAETSLCCC